MRGALFLRVHATGLDATPGQLVAVVVLGLGLQIALAMARSGWSGSFVPDALPRALVYVPLLLLAAWLIGARAGRAALLAVPVLFCAISLVYDLLFELFDQTAEREWLGPAFDYETGWKLLYAVWLAAVLLGTARLAGGGRLRRMYAMAVMGLTVALPLWHLPSGSLWIAQEPEKAAARDAFAVSREEVFYAQPALLESAMSRIESNRPGVTDLYFVGAATYAAEDVFMKELHVIAQLFRDRFDTAQRMLLLVNNPSTAGSEPVATATSIERVLQRVGELMDPEEDVLFLYLTSHGSSDHKLSVEFWPLQLNDVDPRMLRQMLDRAGIKWRVIAISACYSGGFIEALEDEHTLVLTAAEASSQSFGCGAESDFTYFGRAYFDQALRTSPSFTVAFEQAREEIARREQAEALAPSNPQMFVGARVQDKLEDLYRGLQNRPTLMQVESQPAHGPVRECAGC